MWCPSTSLSVWANAWLAGRAAPDDVLDSLSAWAPVQSVAAFDAISIGEAGVTWAGDNDSGVTALLQLVRSAACPNGDVSIQPVFPVAGDVRGLPGGTTFAREAMAAGEAVIIGSPNSSSPIGLVPEFVDATGNEPTDDHPTDDDRYGENTWTELSWTLHALPTTAPIEHHDLGEAEYALRTAVRSAAQTLAATGMHWTSDIDDDPRAVVEQIVQAALIHRMPEHAPPRAVRVLEAATPVEAILTVSSGISTTAQWATEIQRATAEVTRLATVVRSARYAAVSAILHSAWRG